jgi:hypothetical protein
MVSRRRVLRTGLTAAAAVSATAAALRPMLAAGQSTSGGGAARAAAGSRSGQDGQDGKSGASGPAGDEGVSSPLFDEVYRGRHIQGFTSTEPSGLMLLVDGQPLGAMRRVDGSYISMANHYQPYPTPLATARGAVDVIGRAELADAAAAHHH